MGQSLAAQSTPAPEPTLDAKAFNERLKESLKHHALPAPHTPSAPQHVEFVVETNGKGQIARVRGGKESHDATFNAMTYGNALQAFIRTEDGRAIAGTYRLKYDYSPSTMMVTRTVELIRAGGVNPDAIGAVDDMAALNRRRMELDARLYEEALRKLRAKQKHSTSAKPSPSP